MRETRTLTGTLSNGLRYVVREQPGMRVSYSGVVVNAGSREDPEEFPGMAHFVEHTIFKGTRSRSSWQVSNRMESIGGELNAYTSREETAIYTNAPAGYTSRAFELLADLVANSSFPEEEIEREKDVVVEEINSYLDSPFETVYDDFDDLIYKGSAIGHNVLGTADSVRRITPAACRKFLDDRYTADNMVVYCVDGGNAEKNVRLIERYFGSLGNSPIIYDRTIPPMNPQFSETNDRNGHQAHTIIGARLFGRRDPRRFALYLLVNHLGGPAMGSVLNQELRERRGLVYSVDANYSLLSDCGTMTIYYGCDRSDVRKCETVVNRALQRLAKTPVSPRVFERARRQYIGQVLLGAENRETMAQALGKAMLCFGEVLNVERNIERVREVTPQQMREVAELVVPSLCSRLTLC